MGSESERLNVNTNVNTSNNYNRSNGRSFGDVFVFAWRQKETRYVEFLRNGFFYWSQYGAALLGRILLGVNPRPGMEPPQGVSPAQ